MVNLKAMLQQLSLSGCQRYLFIFLLLMTPVLQQAASAAVINEADNRYVLGRGFHLYDNKLVLGGYTNIQFSDFDNEDARLDLRSVSLLVNWQMHPRWQLFSELELVDTLTIQSGDLNADDASLDIERLYLEYAALPNLNIRFGKFLTPVGRWNQIHAAPLVWTVSRPLVSGLPFSRHTTGLSINGVFQSDKSGLDYIFYLDDSEAFDPDGDESFFEGKGSPDGSLLQSNAFENAVGAYFSYKHWRSNLELGFSLVNFRMREIEDRKNLIGVNAFWTLNRVELSSEAIYRFSEDESGDTETGAFVQAVLPIWNQLFGVIRYEKFRVERLDTSSSNTSIGLAYRPKPPVIYKLEYREGDDNLQLSTDGVLASFAVLF